MIGWPATYFGQIPHLVQSGRLGGDLCAEGLLGSGTDGDRGEIVIATRLWDGVFVPKTLELKGTLYSDRRVFLTAGGPAQGQAARDRHVPWHSREVRAHIAGLNAMLESQ
jgi:hypothetical protein